MPADLSGIQEKIKRADIHIGVLNSDAARFQDRCHCKVVEEFDPNSHKHLYLIHGNPPPIALSFSVTLGEAIYQLRTTLDHLVYQLAVVEAERVGKSVTKSTQRGFPVFRHEPITEKPKSRFAGKLQGLSVNAVAEITKLQPWTQPAGTQDDYALTLLDDLHNADKHRLLLVTAAAVNIVGLGIGLHKPGVALIEHVSGFDFRTRMEVKDGAELGHAFGDANMKVDLQTTFHVAFPKIGSAEFEPVMPRIKQLRDFVVGVVDAFQPLL